MTIVNRETTFLGFRRENGRVGVRNHVIVLPLDDLSNAAAEAVAHNIKGALAIPHPYGRQQFSADLELHFRTLIGAGCNPNVAAAGRSQLDHLYHLHQFAPTSTLARAHGRR